MVSPGCTPVPNGGCRVQNDLLLWEGGVWKEINYGKVKWSCSPGSATRSTSQWTCTYDPHKQHWWMSRTWVTTTHNGQTAVSHQGSNSKAYWCDL
ncbi:hypothetical protein GCM10017673_28950 [Streptosporangium violaceochromogenes]|nr:hypothetical protein GCM10017673_28950 [Streptosporangium violaceochromogenes]